jgi:hypothetical protein
MFGQRMGGLSKVPMYVWGLLSLGVAIAYSVFWPEARAARLAPGFARFVVRWFHALVWVLLAISFFVRGRGSPGAKVMADVLALAGLAAYLVFMGVTFWPRR